MSIGNYMCEETLDNIDVLIKDFSNFEDINGFEMRLTDFIFEDHINYTIYLNPVRKPDVKYLITGDNAFIEFENDENLRLSFAKKLKELLINEKYPCSVFRSKCNVVNGKVTKETKWDFNRIEVVL